jgi:hypothetical protein
MANPAPNVDVCIDDTQRQFAPSAGYIPKSKGRCSSAAEQLFRKQQVVRSNRIIGSIST